jgi:hypothetical protein
MTIGALKELMREVVREEQMRISVNTTRFTEGFKRS